MRMTKNWIGMLVVAGGLILVASPAATKENPSALDLAKELNKAFIEVAEKASPSVVVIQVWYKADYEDVDEDDSFWEMLPREWRRRFAEEREQRKQERSDRPSPRDPE